MAMFLVCIISLRTGWDWIGRDEEINLKELRDLLKCGGISPESQSILGVGLVLKAPVQIQIAELIMGFGIDRVVTESESNTTQPYSNILRIKDL